MTAMNIPLGLRKLIMAALLLPPVLLALLVILFAAVLPALRADAWRCIVAVDQLFNAALGGNERETISSRAGKARSQGRAWGCVLCKLLDRIETDHCKKSFEPDVP